MDDTRTTTRSADYDVGRLLMVLVAVAILCIDVAGLIHAHGSGIALILQVIGDVLVIVFYAVLIWCYLRRVPAVATSRSITAHVAAIVATWLPFALPFLRGERPGTVLQTVSDVLLVCGMAWSVWSLRTLGRNVSVLAQARGVVSAGPYGLVRHPLYIGEIVSALGVALAVNSPWAIACWVALAGLQVYRAIREEQVLLATLPAYAAYRAGTPALLPGLRWQRRQAPAVSHADAVAPRT